ncbi:hypothetical protein QYE76_007724 [Lolium multiflorum]|uniref:Transposase (putative) gypsy type domain-containing protein n=1 Tax=Lolium multiflorum TaxID=4521 RepID=A0AAD8QHV6_LOLMU|nr:hypothetical protein QYE76_007724 [Lolium multiflorum]
MGSSVSEYEIDWLYRSRRIPEGVSCRIPGDEIEPVPNPGEYVVFLAHFERGFGLPVSSFFRSFLDFYKLQPHHLPGNAIFYLSCYVTFMEAYIGIRPTRETFARFFALRINSVQGLDIPKPKPPVQCGSCIIGSRQGSPFFKFSGLESCRLWQGTFFYVRNNGAADLIDLPPFDPAPPTKTNWSYNPKESHNETNRIIRFMKQRMKDTNLCSDDIIRTFISRRVLPLKRRAHKMCEMYRWAGLQPRVLARLRRNLPMPSANLNPQVHEHVAPLQAEAGQEFVDKLMAQGQKNKTRPLMPAQAKLLLPSASGPNPSRVSVRRHKGKQMPTATGPALKLGPGLRALPVRPGPRLLLLIPARHHLVPATLPPPLWGAQQVRGAWPLHRQIPARRRTLPPLQRPKTPAPATWAPEEPAGGRNLLFLPSLRRRKGRRLPPRPRRKLRATSEPTPPPETSAPEATGPTPMPPPTAPCAPRPLKITDHPAGASRGKAADGSASSGSQPLVLHVGPAAVVVQDKPSGLLGRIVELKRGGQDLGPLLPYAQRWNDADISAATRGLGKDRLPAPDPAGPRSTEEHFTRLKRAVKEFDSAWYDATANVVSTADARKALFEELLWEHRSLAEAHSQCQELEEGAKALKAAEGKAAKAHKAAAEEAKKAQKAAEGEVARLKAEQKEYDLLAHAIKKVAEHRAQQAGNNLGAPWDPYDHLVALNARVSHMRSVDRNLSDIPEVASQLFKTLWPGEVVPDTFSLIATAGARRRIQEWQCSLPVSSDSRSALPSLPVSGAGSGCLAGRA